MGPVDEVATVALSGRYELGPVLGRGGMADVHRARDRVLGRPVAVKVLRDVSTDPAARDRFLAEARTLAGLSHPGLVTVLDAGVDGDRPCLVMELVEGPTLAAACRPAGLPVGRVAGIGARVADALGYVHGHGVVHRDVKPANVLLSSDGRVLLADFGIAKLTEDAASFTVAGAMVGTAAYLAPELVRGRAVEPAADVYSLGLVLLEALTGRPSYSGAAIAAAVARLHRPPNIPTDLPAPLAALLGRMTSLDPDHRPATAEVAETLRQIADGPVTAPATAAAGAGPSAGTASLTVPELGPLPEGTDPAGATQMLPRSMAHDRGAPAPPGRRPPGTGRRRRTALLVLAAVVVAVFATLALVLAGRDGPDRTPVPPNLPPQITQDLQDLHEAVEG